MTVITSAGPKTFRLEQKAAVLLQTQWQQRKHSTYIGLPANDRKLMLEAPGSSLTTHQDDHNCHYNCHGFKAGARLLPRGATASTPLALDHSSRLYLVMVNQPELSEMTWDHQQRWQKYAKMAMKAATHWISSSKKWSERSLLLSLSQPTVVYIGRKQNWLLTLPGHRAVFGTCTKTCCTSYGYKNQNKTGFEGQQFWDMWTQLRLNLSESSHGQKTCVINFKGLCIIQFITVSQKCSHFGQPMIFWDPRLVSRLPFQARVEVHHWHPHDVIFGVGRSIVAPKGHQTLRALAAMADDFSSCS